MMMRKTIASGARGGTDGERVSIDLFVMDVTAAGHARV
jgi:hypothetical protein